MCSDLFLHLRGNLALHLGGNLAHLLPVEEARVRLVFQGLEDRRQDVPLYTSQAL